MTFKPGDRVKQIQNVGSNENPLATIVKIVEEDIYHIHNGDEFTNCSGSSDFILLKETNWRKRIEDEI